MTKILLAADDQDLRFMLHQMLSNAGYEVESLNEGSDIVNGRVGWPDIFILDQQISKIDGIALSKYLKINKETKDIPIIMISAYPESRSKAKRVGVSDFLQKPFDLKDLLHLIARYANQPYTVD